MKLTKIAALAAALCAGDAFAQSQAVDPNSSFFQVDNYYALTPSGDYERYQVAGYAQVPAPGASPLLFFLPTITVGAQDVAYFRVNGQPFDPRLEPNAQVGSITIKPRSVTTMPTATQIPGIAATLKGEAISAFRVPAWKSSGQPVMEPQAAQWFGPAIQQDYAEYERALAEQDALTQHYRTFQPHSATMQNLEVSLMIGDAIAASRTYTGSISSLGVITLMAPTEFQVNQIVAGNFELLVTSRFRDTKTS
jgi:hypothetical protein